jgi:hypothetical protein
MKMFGLKHFLAVACVIASVGCSKDNNSVLETAAVSEASTSYKLTVPPVPGYTPPRGVEPGQPLAYPIRPHTTPNPTPTTNYGNPGSEYLKGMCLFTISHLEEGSTYHQVNNGKINIAFYNGNGDKRPISVRRLKPTTPSPYGWTAYWNTLYWVENEHPEVLFTNDADSSFIIVLSKPCLKFGMEISPNIQNVPCTLEVTWGNFVNETTSGYFSETPQTPSRALLFAVESETPFSVVTVRFQNKSYFTENPRGLAIANIRYKRAN